MEAVAVQEVVVALEPLRPLAEGPARDICSVVLHQGLLKQHDGSLVVPIIVQPHPRCEGTLGGGGREREIRLFGGVVFSPRSLYYSRTDWIWLRGKEKQTFRN